MLTLLHKEQLDSYLSSGQWQDRTVYSHVRSHAERAPDRLAVRESGRELSYGGLVEEADALASRWREAGLRLGDRVAVWLPSRIETVVAMLACSREGFVVCPSLHRNHTVAEIADLVSRMRAAALIVQDGYGADSDRYDILEQTASCEHIRFVQQLSAEQTEPLPRCYAEQAHTEPNHDPNCVMYLAFTSGTTGMPKGVMHSDNTLLSPVRALADDWALGSDSSIYTFSPLSHNLGFGALILALFIGAELTVHDLPKGQALAERLRQTRATFAFGVPTHAIDLLNELREGLAGGLPELKGFRISGAPVPPSVAEGLLDLGIVPQSGYGMTEAGSHHYTLPNDDSALIVTTSGRPFPGYEVRIFDQEDPDLEVSPGQVGQIGGRGASLMLGYFDDQMSTEASFNRSGWFLTGDLGCMDEKGNLRITGRKKDVIIRGGHNIYPATIEGLVLRHASVARAAALPLADARLGERVCLVVEARDTEKLDPTVVLYHLDQVGLSKFDMPEYFVQVAAIPLLPSGKIFKRRLAEWLEEGRIVPIPVRFQRPKAVT